jgi:hypothetical protein
MVMNAVGSLNYWIGANDRDQTRGWQWTDGSAFYYWNWNDGICAHIGLMSCVNLLGHFVFKIENFRE